jgi:PII-like signaling protein
VDQDCVKLTSYLREPRSPGTVAFAPLAGLPGDGQIAASIVLRGTGGSAIRQHLWVGSPRYPSPSPSPVAVGSRPRLDAVPDRALAPGAPELVTIERATLHSREIDAVGLWDKEGEATKLTVYFNRQDRVYQVPVFKVICELLHRRRVCGATVLAGLDRAVNRSAWRAQLAGRAARTPMMVTAIGSGERLGLMLPELGGLLRHPLITIEKVRVCKRGGRLISPPQAIQGTDSNGRPLWYKLNVYACDSARHHNGRSIHQAISRRIRVAGFGGVFTLRGLWGFRGDQVPHGEFHVPGVTVVIGGPERIATVFSIIDELTARRGLVTSEMVAAVRPPAFATRRQL